jgi:hypothetical protein
LQELILSSGRPYWHRRGESVLGQDLASEQRSAVERDWAWLTANVIDPPGIPASISIEPRRSDSAPRPAQHRWGLRSLALLVSAAVVALAVFTVYPWAVRHQEREPAGGGLASSSGWGWNRPGALPQDLPRESYLNHLADGAQAWFNKRPDDPAALNQRITEFRQGCSVLIESPHRPLPAADRAWLVKKCAEWSDTLGNLVVALQSGEDVIRVRDEADLTINKLIAALRQRARVAA